MKRLCLSLIVVGFFLIFAFPLQAATNIIIDFGRPTYGVRTYYPPVGVYYRGPRYYSPTYYHEYPRHHHYQRHHHPRYFYPSPTEGYVFDNMYGPGASAAGRLSPIRTSNIYYGY